MKTMERRKWWLGVALLSLSAVGCKQRTTSKATLPIENWDVALPDSLTFHEFGTAKMNGTIRFVALLPPEVEVSALNNIKLPEGGSVGAILTKEPTLPHSSVIHIAGVQRGSLSEDKDIENNPTRAAIIDLRSGFRLMITMKWPLGNSRAEEACLLIARYIANSAKPTIKVNDGRKDVWPEGPRE